MLGAGRRLWFGKREQHREFLGGADRVRRAGRHMQEVAGREQMCFAVHVKFAVPAEDLDEGCAGRAVFGERLAGGKREENDAGDGVGKQRAADDAVFGKDRLLSERGQDNLIDGKNRLFGHVHSMAKPGLAVVDLAQILAGKLVVMHRSEWLPAHPKSDDRR